MANRSDFVPTRTYTKGKYRMPDSRWGTGAGVQDFDFSAAFSPRLARRAESPARYREQRGAAAETRDEEWDHEETRVVVVGCRRDCRCCDDGVGTGRAIPHHD